VRNGESGKIGLPAIDKKLLGQMAVPADLFERGAYYKRLSDAEFSNFGDFHTPQLTFSENEVGIRAREKEFFVARAPFRDGFSPFNLGHGVNQHLRKAKDADVKAEEEKPKIVIVRQKLRLATYIIISRTGI
jgi:hypothetical protein